MPFEFYLDFKSSLVFNCLYKGKTEEYDDWKFRLYSIRVFFGFIVNITLFVAVCIYSKEIFIAGATATALFSRIVIHVVIMFATELCVWAAGCLQNIYDTPSFITAMSTYKVRDTIFDILMIFYFHVLWKWEMTEFTISSTVLFCCDIILNCISYAMAFRQTE